MNHRKPKHIARMLVTPDIVREINAHYSVTGENIAMLILAGENGDELTKRIAEAEAKVVIAMAALLIEYEDLQTQRHASAPMPDLMKEELDALQIRTEH